MTQNNAKKNQLVYNLSGDLSGTNLAATVSKIQNKSISSNVPSDKDTLQFDGNNNQWKPQSHIHSSNALIYKIVAPNLVSSYTITSTDVAINVGGFVGGSGGYANIYLIASNAGRVIYLYGSQFTNIKINGPGGGSFNGAPWGESAQVQGILICVDGLNWISGYFTY